MRRLLCALLLLATAGAFGELPAAQAVAAYGPTPVGLAAADGRSPADFPSTTPAVRAALRASGVPVLLPVPVPSALGPIRSVAVISAGASGYYLGFSTVADCAGALSCASFHVAGFREGAPDRSGSGGVPIALPDGGRGVFHPEDCSGASCTEASLSFTRGRYGYEIDVKSGPDDRRLLLEAYRHMRLVR